MSVSVLFAALGGALLVWWVLLQRLKAKPWVEKGILEEEGGIVGVPPARVGLWVFLAVVTSLFGLFAIVYNMRSQFPDWRPLPDPGLLWANTGLLILASVALQRARRAVAQEDLGGLKPNLMAAGVLTFAFLGGQLLAWQQLSSAGHYMATNPGRCVFLYPDGAAWPAPGRWAVVLGASRYHGVERTGIASGRRGRQGAVGRDPVFDLLALSVVGVADPVRPVVIHLSG